MHQNAEVFGTSYIG